MRYVITHLSFKFKQEIEISQEEFEQLQRARSRILRISSLEEKFMIMLENYEELEKEIIQLALHRMIYLDHSYTALIDNIRLLNRRLANFLTTCRLYKDHSLHDISSIYGKESEQFNEYDQLLSQHYDQKIGYRVMEAARNFLQHRSLIVDSILHEAKPIREEERVRHIGSIYLNVHKLREAGEFKKAILSELESRADKNGRVDIRPLVREYMSSFGEIHLALRNMFNNEATGLDTIILDAIQQLNSVSGTNHDSVYVVAYNNENKVSKKFPLIKDFIDRRHRIIMKTQHI